MHVLKWLLKENCPYSPMASGAAAEQNNIKVLEWLYQKGLLVASHAGIYAAECGHLSVLMWLKEKKCIWNLRQCLTVTENPEIKQWLNMHIM